MDLQPFLYVCFFMSELSSLMKNYISQFILFTWNYRKIEVEWIGMEWNGESHLSSCSVVQKDTPTLFMTKIKYPFLKITFCWKPLSSVPWIQCQGRKWGIHEKASSRPQRIEQQNFSLESENRLWPLVATSREKKGADYEHDGNSSWEGMKFSMQRIAWE